MPTIPGLRVRARASEACRAVSSQATLRYARLDTARHASLALARTRKPGIVGIADNPSHSLRENPQTPRLHTSANTQAKASKRCFASQNVYMMRLRRQVFASQTLILTGTLSQTLHSFFQVKCSLLGCACGARPMLTHHALAPQCSAYGLTAYSKEDLHVVPTARKSIYMTKPQAVLRLRQFGA